MERIRLGRILGLDYGERRIGISISDPLHTIASPLRSIDRKVEPDYLKIIQSIIINKEIEKIIIGVPYTMKNKISKQTKIVNEFIQEIKQNLKIPVQGIDERLSTVTAEKELRKQCIKPSLEKSKVDIIAAAIILQEYLDSN